MTAPARLGLSERQQEERATGLGASDVPVMLGMSRWKHPAQLAAEKRGEIEPTPAGEAALWGHRFERPIADEWIARRRAEGLTWSIFTPPTLHHPRSPVVMATCDRIVVPEGRRARSEWIMPVEVKNLSAYRREEFGAEEDAIPDSILVQIQVQLEVTGLPEAWLAVVLGGQSYQERRIPRDEEMGGLLVETAERWWADHVVQGLPVPVDGSEAATAFLRRRYPQETGPVLPRTPAAEELVARLRAAKEALWMAEDAESKIANELRALVGDAAGIEGLLSWKANKPSSKVDWEAVARELLPLAGSASSALIEKFTTQKPGARVLRITPNKAKE